MKKYMTVLLIMGLVFTLFGCTQEPQTAQIANPWKSFDTLAEAEAAAGLDFPIPETVSDSYRAETFRVMNGELLEVIYRDGDLEVVARMQSGEGQDLSGVYESFVFTETWGEKGASVTLKHTKDGCLMLISRDDASYSLYAPKGFAGDSAEDFLNAVCN